MHEKSMKTLEFDKIVRQLAGLSFSAGGARRCERIAPTSDIAAVRARQLETADAVTVISDKGLLPMRGLHDVRALTRRAATGASLNPANLLKVASFLKAVERLIAQLPTDDLYQGNRLYALIRQLTAAPEVEKEISRCVLGENEIADQASPKLASIREDIKRTQRNIRKILDDTLRAKAGALQENLITMRDGRYVLPVKAGHKGEIQGIVHDASASGATLFIEPIGVVNANNHIREQEAAERQEIERILLELSGLVAGEQALLLENNELTDEIDYVLARAQLARRMAAVCPVMNDHGEIDLVQARHPLIPAGEVVPIDLRLGKEYRTLIVTGPNTGGKTVSLKTCGLLTLMAMSGLHIPAAEGSLVSVFTNVMADIGDEQSIEQSLSTFSSHMKNIVSITNAANEGVLVLTDELGSGTDPSEGAALAIAILTFLQQRGATTMASTHYKELKIFALQTPGVENACCEFDVDTLMPTYRLLIGVPGVSNAFVIAKKLGLNKRIISTAKDQLSAESIQFEQAISNIERDRSVAADLRREAERERSAVEAERARLEERLNRLKKREESAVSQVREDAREKLREQLSETEELLKTLRLAGQRVSADRAEALRHGLKRELTQVENAIGRQTLTASGHLPKVEKIKVGENYYNQMLRVTGRIEQGPDSGGRYLFRSGSITTWVEADALSATDQSERTAAPSAGQSTRKRKRSFPVSAGAISGKAQTFVPEIKLIGLTSAEAADRLDHFVDDAVLAGAKSLRVVHGKGTGVLREMVRRNLKSDKRVASFREGAYGEGDSGVTIAELK